jgi:hypothetical protein
MSHHFIQKLHANNLIPQEGVASFIRKTYELLEEQKHSDIVCWSDDGNFLVIKDIQKFSQKVLPVYFKHNKMNSFVRQLNMYNFRKKRTMTTDHLYFHELFKQGRTDLLPLIKRKNTENLPNSNLHPSYAALQNLSATTNEISQENNLLKKLNQKAFSKIKSLESKINELFHENQVLHKNVDDKHRKEDFSGNKYSHCFPSHAKPCAKHSFQPTGPVCIHQSGFQDYLSTNSNNLYRGINMQTPETALPSDSSSVDSYLNLENNDAIDASNMENTSSDEEAQNSAFDYPNFDEDISFLGKRKLNDVDSVPLVNNNMSWEILPFDDEFNLFQDGPTKAFCSGIFDGKEQKLNLLNFEFPCGGDDKLPGGY